MQVKHVIQWMEEWGIHDAYVSYYAEKRDVLPPGTAWSGTKNLWVCTAIFPYLPVRLKDALRRAYHDKPWRKAG